MYHHATFASCVALFWMRLALVIILLMLQCFPHLVRGQSAALLLHTADSMYEQNDYASAIKTYLQALQLAEKTGDQASECSATVAVARCQYRLHDRTASMTWFYRYLKVVEQNRADSLLSDAYYFIGVMYIERSQVDSAEKYAFKAIGLMEKAGDYAKLAKTYCTLSELHMNGTKNVSKIEQALDNAEKYAQLSGDESMLAFSATKRFNYHYFFRKDYRTALIHINKAEKLYQETGNREAILNSYRGKAECLIMLRDTTAINYIENWFLFKDSVFHADKAIQIAQFETLYEVERKEQANQLLQQQNDLAAQKVYARNVTIFSLLALLGLSIVLGLWWVNRNNRIKSEAELAMLQNQQLEKERIARDLHDNVGGQLAYMIHTLEHAKDGPTEKRKQILEDVGQSARSVIKSLRETIWAINDSNIKTIDLIDKLKLHARTLFRNTDVELSFTQDIDPESELQALVGLNLYRICQEILTNAFKHSKASQLRVSFRSQNGKLMVTITDNGVGFETGLNAADSYGLQNIRKRAAESNISLSLKTSIDQGTEYLLIV